MNALDTTIAVVTPENISFEYQLAGPFRRLPAYLIDLGTRWAMIAVVGFAFLLLGASSNIPSLGSFLLAAAMVLYFVLSWFYGAWLETYFNGRTIGKWACGLRVICVDGRPIDGTRAVVRNLVRVIDMSPFVPASLIFDDAFSFILVPTGLIGFIAAMCTTRMQRLGDLAAGTMVVVDERNWRIPITTIDDPRAMALALTIPTSYRVSRSMARTLAIFSERRAYLSPGRRREVASYLTKPLCVKFNFRADTDPDLMMMALYCVTFLSDPRTDAAELSKGVTPVRLAAERDESTSREEPNLDAGTTR